jgi:hypothetical protein
MISLMYGAYLNIWLSSVDPICDSRARSIIPIEYQEQDQQGKMLSLHHQLVYLSIERQQDLRWKLAVTKSIIQFPAPLAVG